MDAAIIRRDYEFQVANFNKWKIRVYNPSLAQWRVTFYKNLNHESRFEPVYAKYSFASKHEYSKHCE